MTLKERLPKVLTQIIDTIHRHQEAAVAQHGVVRGNPLLHLTFLLLTCRQGGRR